MEPGQLDIETYKQIKEIQDNPDMGMYYEAHLDLLDQNLEFTAENLDKMVQKRALGKITDPGARDKYINALQSIYSDNLVIVKDPTVTDDDNMTYLGLVTYEHKVTEFIGEEKNMHLIVDSMAKKMLNADVLGPEAGTSLSYLVNNPIGEISVQIEDITGAQLLSMWCVSQYSGDFNPLHIHSGDISGVIYLKIPEGRDEEYEKEDHHPSIGDIQFIAGTPQAFSRNTLKIKPKVGDMFVFPAWLHHTVYPFRTPNQERRTLSYNLIYTNNKGKMSNFKIADKSGK